MGIAFITAKAEKFKHQRDAAYEQEFAQEGVLSALPDKIEQSYRCQLIAQEFPGIGTRVLLLRSGAEIQVISLNIMIGMVLSPDSDELWAIMTAKNTDVLTARVVELHPISKMFGVRVHRKKS